MTERQQFMFTVTVTTEIGIPDGDEHGRTAGDYAHSALLASAGLAEASHLDGFADLEGEAWISDVREWP